MIGEGGAGRPAPPGFVAGASAQADAAGGAGAAVMGAAAGSAPLTADGPIGEASVPRVTAGAGAGFPRSSERTLCQPIHNPAGAMRACITGCPSCNSQRQST